MGKVYRRPAARRDLITHTAYLIENAGEAVADRFLSQVETSFDDLAGQPLMGAKLTTRHQALTGILKWRVRGFDNYLVFYIPRPDGVLAVVGKPPYARGSRTTKRAPDVWPHASRRFSAAMFPCSASMIWRLIDSPSPECCPNFSPFGRSE